MSSLEFFSFKKFDHNGLWTWLGGINRQKVKAYDGYQSAE